MQQMGSAANRESDRGQRESEHNTEPPVSESERICVCIYPIMYSVLFQLEVYIFYIMQEKTWNIQV